MLNGQAIGIWKTKKRRDILEITLEPFENLPDNIQPLIENEAKDLARFLATKTSLTNFTP
jgi:hypothetical protein